MEMDQENRHGTVTNEKTILNCLHVQSRTEKPAKLAMMLHGFGSSASDMLGLAKIIAHHLPDIHFILPDAPSICAINPDGFEWFDLSSRETELMLRNIKQPAKILNNTLNQYIEQDQFRESEIVFLGFSQGAMMSLYTGLRHVKNCQAIVSFSGAIIEDAETLSKAIISNPRVCLIHGKQDDVVPFDALETSNQKLQDNNIKTESFAINNMGHQIDEECLDIAINFLKQSY